ncbi:hypothetical protein N7532_011095 [Penicillium argentinense]|uniref:Rhodopsin domain-containing protein n=1 Tax=Penicillium argentinense TaxID=1131581 RepID=A0A9W9JUX4_9EURO|nr:uncharacterized protein N7532_011095 [Penicillium argentinense]KAJ5082052.1 hypothetical protein N7532_011095 [Penicillium argentinense]
MGDNRWVDKSSPCSSGGNALIGVSIALSIVQIIFVAARFLTRYMQRIRFGLDDYMILIALIGSLTKAVTYIVLTEVAGLGYHIDEVTHPNHKIAMIKKGFFALELLDFPFTITPAKISLLLFYLRIFNVRKFQITTYIVGSLVLAVGITVFFGTIFQCTPVDYGWDKSSGSGSCVDQITFYRGVSPVNALTGIMILIMPLPLIWQLHAPRGQKLALTGVFLLGGLGSIASIFRMIIYFLNTKVQLKDVTWFSIRLGILTVVEGAVIIIATCLVTIWPLVSRITSRRLMTWLSCSSPRKHQHQCWYLRTIEEPSEDKSQIPIARCRGVMQNQKDESWSSLPPFDGGFGRSGVGRSGLEIFAAFV